MALFRSKAERKVADAGYDPARLPPGQYLTEKWPVLHAGSIPDTELATWEFFVEGEVETPLRLSWDELNALPRTSHTQDIHCVTRWSRGGGSPTTCCNLSSPVLPPSEWSPPAAPLIFVGDPLRLTSLR